MAAAAAVDNGATAITDASCTGGTAALGLLDAPTLTAAAVAARGDVTGIACVEITGATAALGLATVSDCLTLCTFCPACAEVQAG